MDTVSERPHGMLFVISGPSGVGKTVLCNEMIDRFHPNMVYSISATSRAPRGGEKDGQEYFFYTPKRFEAEIARGCFAEWAVVHGNYYGTPRAFLDRQRDTGRHVLLNIDVQGAFKIRKAYPESVMIFIMPPSIESLEKRIRNRNMDTEDVLQQRLKNAREEISCRDQYDHILVNDDLSVAVDGLATILDGCIWNGRAGGYS
ncbi:MAG TPA: guanylate kinase [Candidatus Ozemobacteraceae bacterium]|nr:guanylate kinase [Candidatus Ozemobacteraceae bacterium]